MIAFSVGLLIGALLGVVLVCCLVVARAADDALETRLRASQGTEDGA